MMNVMSFFIISRTNIFMEAIWNDLYFHGFIVDMVYDRVEWHNRIHVSDPQLKIRWKEEKKKKNIFDGLFCSYFIYSLFCCYRVLS